MNKYKQELLDFIKTYLAIVIFYLFMIVAFSYLILNENAFVDFLAQNLLLQNFLTIIYLIGILICLLKGGWWLLLNRYLKNYKFSSNPYIIRIFNDTGLAFKCLSIFFVVDFIIYSFFNFGLGLFFSIGLTVINGCFFDVYIIIYLIALYNRLQKRQVNRKNYE